MALFHHSGQNVNLIKLPKCNKIHDIHENEHTKDGWFYEGKDIIKRSPT